MGLLPSGLYAISRTPVSLFLISLCIIIFASFAPKICESILFRQLDEIGDILFNLSEKRLNLLSVAIGIAGFSWEWKVTVDIVS